MRGFVSHLHARGASMVAIFDASNVTHILGVRVFGTQLLCEQVVGRALRRQPRKRIRAKHGRGRVKAQKMYLKMRMAKHLKVSADADSATVKFSGRDAWIARVAQYGLTDRVSPNGPSVRYPQRPLLGFVEADRAWIQDFLIQNLLPDA